MGAYGHSEPTSPNIDALAAQGILFEEAAAQAPWTIPSFSSMMTGMYPNEVNVLFNTGALSSSFSTLAELLSSKGFKTATFNGHAVLRKRGPGLNQGFNHVFPDAGNGWGATAFKEIEPELSRWLEENAGEKFFLWAHMMEVHGTVKGENPFKKGLRGQYDARVRWADDFVGRIVSKLSQLGIDDQTMIILTADHGEGLGEHNSGGHQTNVHREVAQVPLIVRHPRWKPGRATEIVELVDLFPTVLEATGNEVPGEISGESLVPLLEGRKNSRRKDYGITERFHTRGFHHIAVKRGPFRLYLKIHNGPLPDRPENIILDWKLDGVEVETLLFDHTTDRRELKNVADQHPEKVAELMQILRSWKERGDRLRQAVSARSKPDKVDPDVLKSLKTLGYTD